MDKLQHYRQLIRDLLTEQAHPNYSRNVYRLRDSGHNHQGASDLGWVKRRGTQRQTGFCWVLLARHPTYAKTTVSQVLSAVGWALPTI